MSHPYEQGNYFQNEVKHPDYKTYVTILREELMEYEVLLNEYKIKLDLISRHERMKIIEKDICRIEEEHKKKIKLLKKLTMEAFFL